MYLGDVMTVTLNLAGLPGVCLPCGVDASAASPTAPPLPVGLQIVAGPHADVDAVRVAHAFERTAAFAALGRAPLAAPAPLLPPARLV
jgi:aspartyl-tRNA(Asn)/glutamyl-tRNA(Gln) amidotransferase subunit A